MKADNTMIVMYNDNYRLLSSFGMYELNTPNSFDFSNEHLCENSRYFMRPIILAFFLLAGCNGPDDRVTIKIGEISNLGSSNPIFELKILKNETLVAHRKYENGKLIFSNGEIATLEIDAAELKVTVDPKENKRGVVYLSGGEIVAESYHKEGKNIQKGEIPDGIIIEKYKSGHLKNIFQYSNGKRNGPAISFYKSGNIKAVGKYKEDYPTGVGKLFYENGGLKAEWKVVGGKEIYHKEFDSDGTEK